MKESEAANGYEYCVLDGEFQRIRVVNKTYLLSSGS